LPHEREEVTFTNLQTQTIQRAHLFAYKPAPKMHVDVVGDDHMTPEQNRLLSERMISSSDSVL
jgi:hypothetical protein